MAEFRFEKPIKGQKGPEVPQKPLKKNKDVTAAGPANFLKNATKKVVEAGPNNFLKAKKKGPSK